MGIPTDDILAMIAVGVAAVILREVGKAVRYCWRCWQLGRLAAEGVQGWGASEGV